MEITGASRLALESLSARRAWIEIYERGCFLLPLKESLSARRAWIEIRTLFTKNHGKFVALRKESVDRNYYADKDCDWVRVALRKESVDRNLYLFSFVLASLVALRKESVDRNHWPDL